MAQAGQRRRVARTATVVRAEWVSPTMRRVWFTGSDLACLRVRPHTDHYVKILFAPHGADYRWPFDPEQLKATAPAEQWPVTRTYTVRAYDEDRDELAIDFVVHGDEGLAGPWAAAVEPGDQIGFYGPGGAYTPDSTADAHLLIGDEAAIPAICATLDRLGHQARATVYLEVEGAHCRQEVSSSPLVDVVWVHREGRPYGDALATAVREGGVPSGDVQAFVHGNADMIRQLRRHLFTELDFNRNRVSMSGYWRTGQTEDGWQATKRDFNASLERSDGAAAAA